MSFRYQPVLRTRNVNGIKDECVSLVEVYLDDEDRLTNWTECLQCAPIGNDISDLSGEISHMWIAALCWEPIPEDQLTIGATFTASVTQEKRKELAAFLERGGSFLRAI